MVALVSNTDQSLLRFTMGLKPRAAFNGWGKGVGFTLYIANATDSFNYVFISNQSSVIDHHVSLITYHLAISQSINISCPELRY